MSCIHVVSVDYGITKKNFNFPKKHSMPFYFVSASDGTNVVKVILIIYYNLLIYNIYIKKIFELSHRHH